MITKFELFESLFDSLFEDKTWSELKHYYINKIKSADDIPIDDEIGELIFSTDPTPQKTYHKWLIAQYRKLTKEDFLSYLDDANELLNVYHNGYKRLPKEYEQYKQITKLDFEGLETAVEIIVQNALDVSKRGEKKKLSQLSKIRVESEYILLHEDDEWAVVVPLSHAQSRYWAHNSETNNDSRCSWCTAQSSDAAHYKSYTSVGPLYIFHNKKGLVSGRRLSHQLFINGLDSSGKRTEFKNCGGSEIPIDKFFSQYKHLMQPLVEFWSNPEYDKYLGNSLDTFLTDYLKNPERYTSYAPIADMISASTADLRISERNLERMMLSHLNSLNIQNIKKFFDKYPEKINSKFNEKGNGNMTPMFTVIKSQTPLIEDSKRDQLTNRIVKYLISKGADGSGTDENGDSNILSECISSKKFKTLITVSDLKDYDINDLNTKNNVPIPFLIVTATDFLPNDLTFEEFDIIVGKLVEKGMDLNAPSQKHIQNKKLMTCLTPIFLKLKRHMAEKNQDAIKNSIEILKVLLKHGANPCLSTDGNGDPLALTDLFDSMKGDEIYSIWNEASKNCK